MNARCRPVWLVLDPFTGERALLGVLIAEGQELGFVATAEPAWRRLSPANAALAELVLEELHGAASFDEAPAGAGPQVVYGDPAEVPDSVEVPRAWVTEWVERDAA